MIVPTGASAVAVMADVEAGAAMSAVIVQRVARKVAANNAMNSDLRAARKAAAMNGANAALSSAVQSRVASNAMNNGWTARSHANHAHRVSHVNRAKVAAKSAHAVNVVSATPNRDQSVMPPSRTLPWPTRLRWQPRWAAQRLTQTRKPHAVSVDAATTAAMSRVMNVRI